MAAFLPSLPSSVVPSPAMASGARTTATSMVASSGDGGRCTPAVRVRVRVRVGVGVRVRTMLLPPQPREVLGAPEDEDVARALDEEPERMDAAQL